MSSRANIVLAEFGDRLRRARLRASPGRYVRPHNLTTLLADSLALYRDNWLPLTGIYLIPAFGLTLLSNRLDSNPQFGDALVLSLLYVKLTIILLGPLTVATSEACLGWPMSVLRAYRRVLGTILLRLIAAGLIGLTLILSGFAIVYFAFHDFEWLSSIPEPVQIAAALAVALPPMLVFGARYMFVQQAIILEHCSLLGAFARSRALAQGYSMRNLLYFLTTAGALVVAAAIGNDLVRAIDMPDAWPRWAAEIGTILLESAPGVIATPIIGITLVLLYYDLRVRKEHFDLEQLDLELHG